MKILHVIASMDPEGGGVSQALRNIIPELDKLGVSSVVASLDHPSASYLGKDIFQIIALGPSITSWRYSSKLIPYLKKNSSNFTHVIVHGLWQFHGYAVWHVIQNKIRRGKSTPKFFIIPHGMLDPYFQKAPERKLKALRNLLIWNLFEAKIINQANGILFTCETELRLARETFPNYKPTKELNVSFGIQPPPLKTEVLESALFSSFPQIKSNNYILFLGRIDSKKGVDLLIKAYENVYCNDLNDEQIPYLVIAGPGIETEFGKNLKKVVDSNEKLSKLVIFTGMLKGHAKWALFYNCEVFVLPSHQENFGIAVAEAMACNAPVLISNQVNIWREIFNSGGGLIANDNLQGTIELLSVWRKLSASEKQSMGQKARLCFENQFSITPATKILFQTLLMN
jgi:glycosyltransferase involved in cell wall biosynthesis